MASDNTSHKPIIISMIALIASFCTMGILLLSFLSNDIGILFGKANAQASVIKDRIKIVNQLYGLRIEPSIEIYNKGKQPELIGGMLLYISSPKMKQIFIPAGYFPLDGNEGKDFGSFILRPETIWNARVSFSKKLTEKEDQDISHFEFQIAQYFQKIILDCFLGGQYKNNDLSKLVSPILPKKMYSQLLNIQKDKIDNLEKGDYNMLILIIGGENNQKIIFEKGFTFNLDDNSINGLKTYQLNSYNIYPIYNRENDIFSYRCTPKLKELNNENLSMLLQEFKRLSASDIPPKFHFLLNK